MKKIAIIGAGISGVALAYLLSESGAGKDDITVFDKNTLPGGCIQSAKVNGYLVESGPNGILAGKTDAIRLFKRAGIGDILLQSSSYTGTRYLYANHKLYKAPQNPISAALFPLLSFKGKLRILKEPFIKPVSVSEDETVHDFFTRRLGEEAADVLISTLIGGIYAGDSKKLSMSSAFPVFHNLEREHGGLFKGMLRRMKNSRKNKSGSSEIPRSRLISGECGMQDLVRGLASKCSGVNFRFGTGVEKVSMVKCHDGKKRYTLSSAGATDLISHGEFDIVALCCNARDAGPLIKDFDSRLYAELCLVNFAPVAICALGYDKVDIAHPLDGFGYLAVPQAGTQSNIIIGNLFSSSLYRGRAPEGKVLLTCITCGVRNPDAFYLSDAEIESKVREELKVILKDGAVPEFVHIKRTKYALPQYGKGHYQLKNAVNDFQNSFPGLFIGGNTTSGISVSDCMLLSTKLAHEIDALF